MKNDTDFNIRLIKLVEKYPPLYNKLDQANNRQEVEKIWQDIADLLNETVTSCVSKWTTLRNNYIRLVKENLKTHTGLQNSKSFYLAKSMQFLLPYLKIKSDLNTHFEQTNSDLDTKRKVQIITAKETKEAYFNNIGDASTVVTLPKRHLRAKISMNSTINDNRQVDLNEQSAIQKPEKQERSEKPEKPDKPERQVPILTKDTNFKYSPDSSECLDSSVKKKISKMRPKKTLQNPPIEPFKKPSPMKEPAKNADMAFFQSLLPLVGKLSDTQKIRFRISAMQILENIVDGDEYNNASLLQVNQQLSRYRVQGQSSTEPSLTNLKQLE